MSGTVDKELLGVADEWDRAMVANDPEAIGLYLADDWTIVGPDVSDKATFLEWCDRGP